MFDLKERAWRTRRVNRMMEFYTNRSLYVIKPNERRYWQVSDAQVDVSLILKDQQFRLATALEIASGSGPENQHIREFGVTAH
jgi:hypothetical protein